MLHETKLYEARGKYFSAKKAVPLENSDTPETDTPDRASRSVQKQCESYVALSPRVQGSDLKKMDIFKVSIGSPALPCK